MTLESSKKCILKNYASEARKESTDSVTYWSSIYAASILSFIGSVQFSLYFSSLWPYLQIVNFLFIINTKFFINYNYVIIK